MIVNRKKIRPATALTEQFKYCVCSLDGDLSNEEDNTLNSYWIVQMMPNVTLPLLSALLVVKCKENVT